MYMRDAETDINRKSEDYKIVKEGERCNVERGRA